MSDGLDLKVESNPYTSPSLTLWVRCVTSRDTQYTNKKLPPRAGAITQCYRKLRGTGVEKSISRVTTRVPASVEFRVTNAEFPLVTCRSSLSRLFIGAFTGAKRLKLLHRVLDCECRWLHLSDSEATSAAMRYRLFSTSVDSLERSFCLLLLFTVFVQLSKRV